MDNVKSWQDRETAKYWTSAAWRHFEGLYPNAARKGTQRIADPMYAAYRADVASHDAKMTGAF
jgi:hypothetical protein